MRKTTKRKASPMKKRAARKPARKMAKKMMRKPIRKASAHKVAAGKGNTKSWTAAEVKMLKQGYKSTPTIELARKLHRSLSSVRSKAVALSLKKAAPRKAAAKKAAPKKAAPKKKMRRCS